MDLLPHHRYDPATWHDKLEDVSGFYGPGATLAWFVGAISMVYDANFAYKTNADGFQYLKYAGVIFTSVAALCDAVRRALHADFGPSYAAALYMSDKGFELATLLYAVALFPISRRGSDQASIAQHQDLPVAEQPGNTSVPPFCAYFCHDRV